MCEEDFAEIGLPPSVGVDYLWSPAESLSNPGISNPIATPEQSTTYTLIASTTACTDTITQYVDVHTLDATLTGDSMICLGNTATLTITAQSADIYHIEWSETADFQQIIATETNSITITPTSTRTYYVRVTTDECVRIYAFPVTVIEISISGNQDYLRCFEDYLELGVTCGGGISPYQYTWQLGDGSTYSDANPHVTPQHSTTYDVTVTDALGCTATAGGFITVQEGTFSEGMDAWCEPCLVVAYHETALHATDYGSDYIYQWAPSSDMTTPNQPNTIVTPDTTTTYTVTVTDTYGCVKSDTVTIAVQPITCSTPFVFIPNSFTPNGDGVNDVLYVRSDILEECYFVVYNRWGEKIFETRDNTFGWDGTFHGQECPRATYDWYFKGTCKDGDETEMKGSVTLLR
jgi:gliding motility-associated-like protein